MRRTIAKATAIGAIVAAAACAADRSTDPATTLPPETSPSTGPATGTEGSNDPAPVVAPPVKTSTPGAVRLLAEAQRILAHMKTSSYSHTTMVDEAAGSFVFDCSGFVDYALARVVPEGFTSLAAATVQRPVAESYVSFVSALPASAVAWRTVARGRDLVAGDIIAWLEPADTRSTNTGHVMIVGGDVMMNGSGELFVPVIDSSESGHGPDDPRTIMRTTGLGSGTAVLLLDGNGAPTGYRWSTIASSQPHTTKVSLGHLE